MASVTLKDVVKVYEGGVKVVDRLNLDIADREFVVLVGPSGCGKVDHAPDDRRARGAQLRHHPDR